MIWVGVVVALSSVAIDINSLRQAKLHEIVVYVLLIIMALAMSALVSWHLWPTVHLLTPFDVTFGPLTKWLYKIL